MMRHDKVMRTSKTMASLQLDDGNAKKQPYCNVTCYALGKHMAA